MGRSQTQNKIISMFKHLQATHPNKIFAKHYILTSSACTHNFNIHLHTATSIFQFWLKFAINGGGRSFDPGLQPSG